VPGTAAGTRLQPLDGLIQNLLPDYTI